MVHRADLRPHGEERSVREALFGARGAESGHGQQRHGDRSDQRSSKARPSSSDEWIDRAALGVAGARRRLLEQVAATLDVGLALALVVEDVDQHRGAEEGR